MRLRLAVFPALVGLALAVACQTPAPSPAPAGTKPGAAATPAAAVPAPNVPQRLTAALPDLPQSDLNTYNAGYPNGYAISTFMEGLITFQNERTELKGLLAQSWRNVDPTTWEFTLKPNVRFHDGSMLTAEDVVFSTKNAINQEVAALAFAVMNRNLLTMADITAPSPTVVRVTTKGPDPILPNRFGALGVYVYPKRAFETLGRERFFMAPIGTGPFKLKSFTPKQRVELTGFEGWHGGKVNLAEFNQVAITDNAARIAALKTGEVDMVERVDIDQLPDVAAISGAKAVIATFNVGVVVFLDTTQAELRDRRVRLAMNHAIDINSLVKNVLRDVTKPLPGQPVPLTTFGANQTLTTYPFNEQRARQLMAEAGFPNGFRLDLGVPSFREQFQRDGQAIQPMLARIGVQTDLKSFDINTFLQGFATNRLGPMVVSAVSTAELADPATAYAAFTSQAAGMGGTGRYNNPDYDNLYRQSLTEMDINRRRSLYEQMNKLFNDDPPVITLYQFWNGWAITDRVGPFKPTPGGQPESWATLMRVK